MRWENGGRICHPGVRKLYAYKFGTTRCAKRQSCQKNAAKNYFLSKMIFVSEEEKMINIAWRDKQAIRKAVSVAAMARKNMVRLKRRHKFSNEN